MGALGWVVLLALVLLGATTEHELSGSCAGEYCCEVTGVHGTTASLQCPGEPSDKDRRGERKTGQHEETDSETYVSKTIRVEGVEKPKPGEHGSSKYLFSRKVVESHTYREPSDGNRSEINSSSVTNKTSPKITNKEKGSGVQDCWNSYRRVFEGINTIEVNFVKNFSSLNVSSFPNARTVIIKVNNGVQFNVCGKTNISSVVATSTGLSDVQFINSILSVSGLNLSNNAIQYFPFEILPSSVVTLDISNNYIAFNKSIVLRPTLRDMNVSNNSKEPVDGFTLVGNLTVLDMSENGLEIFPKLLLERLEELYISKNKITTLVNGCFSNMSSLIIIDLHYNRIKTIEETTFEGLTKLQKLDLSKNNLILLGPTTFQFLNSLITLKVSKNVNLGNPQDIEEAYFLFGTSQRLQIIEASNINMTKIPSTISRSVRKLRLSNNMIDIIQCGQLDSFPLLQVLDVSNNLIKDIEEDALGRLDFLSHILLQSNQLKWIPKSLPNQLQVLDLRHNEVKNLTKYDFLGLQKLQVLLLSNNKIQIIEDGTFGQLVSLEVLDLSYNPIKALSRSSLIGPRRLKEMHLNSLKDIIPLQDPLSFPAPESAHLEVLSLESSPVLASQLMNDVAALTMFHELFQLNLKHCRLSYLRDDLPKYLPRLHKLELYGNSLNCTHVIWLVKWLQALNISMQDTSKLRQDIYNLKDVRKEDNDAKDTSVKCASPEDLVGREIISLKDEDFPDLKLTSSSLPPTRQVVIKSYLQQTSVDNTSNLIDSSQLTSSNINNTSFSPDPLTISSTSFSTANGFISKTMFTTPNRTFNKTVLFLGINSTLFTDANSNINDLQSTPSLMSKASSLINMPSSVLFSETVESLQPTTSTLTTLPTTSSFHTSFNVQATSKQSEPIVASTYATTLEKPPLKRINSINRELRKYQKGSKQKNIDPNIVLLNNSSIIKDFDNHVNGSVSLGAFSASKPPMSHPGMFLFVSVVGLILLVSGVMAYSHFQQRRGRDYQHHQDIEVNSLGGYDLW